MEAAREATGSVQSQQVTEDSAARAGPERQHSPMSASWLCCREIHHFTHVLNCFKSSFIRFIYWGFIENNPSPPSLVQDPHRKHKRTQVKAGLDTSTEDAAHSPVPHFLQKGEATESASCICACLASLSSQG